MLLIVLIELVLRFILFIIPLQTISYLKAYCLVGTEWWVEGNELDLEKVMQSEKAI